MGAAPAFTLTQLRAVFPRYDIEREIRCGGQGAVYKAVRTAAPDDSPRREQVALKLYFDPDQNERVRREINALEGYDHPNLARLIEHGTVIIGTGDTDYIAWEYIDGQPLDLRLQNGAIPPRLVCRVGRDVSRAIVHIWNKRIVHRDIKPNNIIIHTGDIDVVLIDLGIARHLTQTTITGPGLIWGTYGYYSPEQSRGETQLTCHSDVFTLGIVLQQCLCGVHPTNGNQGMLVATPPRTATISPACPAALADLIDSMLQRRAAFRPTPSDLSIAFADLAARI